jgi:hypothetical protein
MTKKTTNNVYDAGKGYPSTGATAGCKAGHVASSSSNRGLPGVDRQASGRVQASGEKEMQPMRSREMSEGYKATINSTGPSRDGLPLWRSGGRVGRGWWVRRRNVVVFSVSGHTGRLPGKQTTPPPPLTGAPDVEDLRVARPRCVSDPVLLPAPGTRKRRRAVLRDGHRISTPTQGPPPPPIFGCWRLWWSCHGRRWAS